MRIELTESQGKFINSNYRNSAFIGGYGSGKTFVGILKIVREKLRLPGTNMAYYMPTYPLIRDVAFPRISDMLDQTGIKYRLNKSDKEFITDFGSIIMRSMDDPSLIVGYEVAYSIVDEADVLPKKKMKDAFVKITARNRQKINEQNKLDFVSTPEGYGFLYDFFVKKSSENKNLIHGSTYENKHNLPDDYIDSLKEDYTANELKAYLNGEFANFSTGNVYYNFKRTENHSNRIIQSNDILHIGMDFNITNMSAVIRVMDGAVSTAVAEITKAYDTAQMIEIIKNRYPNHKIVIYPDASSKNRRSAGQSDLDLLKEAKFQIRINDKNPRVSDRISIVNKTFLNAVGERVNFINTNQCPELTEAYEQLGYRNGLPDKESGFDHLTDADGYAICGLLGVRKPRASFGSGGRLL